MELKILGSSSAGNCYLLENEHECLIIEAGVKFLEVKKAIGFKTDKIVGLILTHEHGDHAGNILSFAENGISCYMSAGTMNALKSGSHRYNSLKAFERKQVGSFVIMPFDVEHDAVEPFGFIVQHAECGNVLFLTDAHFCKYTFDNLSQVIIEANYSEKIINERVYSGSAPMFLRNRVIGSHMSLETCIKTLEANDLSKVNNIVLIHLSDGNSNSVEFKRSVEYVTGKQTHIADAGSKINFNRNIF